MSITETVLRAMGLPALGAVGAAAWVTGWGPYGFTQDMPARCEAPAICITVAGIDGDVNFVPTAGDMLGIDIEDDVGTRVVRWLRESAPADVEIRVLKYPREIAMPDVGVDREQEQRARALTAAREAGERFGSTLVVVGSIDNADVLTLAFVHPGDESMAPHDYPLPESAATAPEGLRGDFHEALFTAMGMTPPPREEDADAPPATAAQQPRNAPAAYTPPPQNYGAPSGGYAPLPPAQSYNGGNPPVAAGPGMPAQRQGYDNPPVAAGPGAQGGDRSNPPVAR